MVTGTGIYSQEPLQTSFERYSSLFDGREKERFYCDIFCYDIHFNIKISDIINSNGKGVHNVVDLLCAWMPLECMIMLPLIFSVEDLTNAFIPLVE